MNQRSEVSWAALILVFVGLFGVALKASEATMGKGDILNFPHTFLDHTGVSVVAFALLAYSLFYFARKPLKK